MRPIDADAFKKYIDAQEGRPFIGCTVGEAMKILIDEQPTIQPVATDTNVGSNSEIPNSSDAISRQAAIDALDCINGTEEVLRSLPPAQPECQKGEWIDYTEDGYVECPFCRSATNCDGNKDELHFCFSCGADMRGEQDG